MRRLVLLLTAMFSWGKPCSQCCRLTTQILEISQYSKVYMTLSPNDDNFVNGSTIKINCTGVEANNKFWDRYYNYPKGVKILLDDSNQIKYCSRTRAKQELTPVLNCAVNHTFDEVTQHKITCLVFNKVGKCSKTFSDINITVPKPPSLAEQPPRLINTSEGLDLNITCKSFELPRPVITWYKNDDLVIRHNVMSYRGVSTLMLRSIVPDDEGRYWCQVNSSLGKVASSGTSVTVFTPPRFLQGPSNQNVTVEDKLTLTCQASGYPLPLIGWRRNGEDLGTGIYAPLPRDLKENNVVPFVSASSSSSSSFEFSTFKSASSSSPASNISTLQFSPSASPSSSLSSSSSPSSLSSSSLSSSSSPSSLSSSSSSLSLSSSSPSSSSPSSSLSSLSSLSSSSSPSSSVNSKISQTVTTVNLSSKTQQIPSSPTKNLDTLTIISDTPTTIPNTATLPLDTATIKPTTTTTTPDIPSTIIPKRPFNGLIKQDGYKSTLHIKSTEITDQAKYQCYASNALGNVNSTVALVLVRIQESKELRFDVHPKNTSVHLETKVTLNCNATGIPTPKITWYKDNKLVTPDGRVSITVVKGMSSLLKISSVSRPDQGLYLCRATNKLGSVESAVAFLYVIDLPGARVGPSNTKTQVVLWSTVGSLMFLGVVIVMIAVCIVKRRQKAGHTKAHPQTMEMSAQNGEKSLTPQTNETLPMNQELLGDLEYLRFMGMDRDWELPRDRLVRTNDKLGSGCFGNVYSGVYTRKDGKEMLVAVKMLKVNATDEDRKDLLAELEILKQVGRHNNIVSLVGACTKDEPVCIAIELVEGGNLQQFLKKTRVPYLHQGYENIRSTGLTDRDLVTIALDIAKGMSHLHKKQCIHRDLAARNVLIGKGLVAKIADFGLARNIPSDGLYVKTTGGRIPWKWMAPEALRGLFTKHNDIWSYGILLWEIATLGDTPYPNISQVIPLYNLLVDGYRLEKPPQCDELLYELMNACWSVECCSRPGFDEIQTILTDILNQNKRIYINLMAMDLEDETLEHSL